MKASVLLSHHSESSGGGGGVGVWLFSLKKINTSEHGDYNLANTAQIYLTVFNPSTAGVALLYSGFHFLLAH